jgi:hypothetical protein
VLCEQRVIKIARQHGDARCGLFEIEATSRLADLTINRIGGWMLELLLSLFISAAAAQGSDLPTPPCDTRSEFKGTTHARLGRLKGTVSMLQPLRCSGAFVTFADRGDSSRGLVLTSGHCAGQGAVKAPSKAGTVMSFPDVGEVLVRVADKRWLTLETGQSEEPRVCVQSEEIVFATLTDIDIMILQLTETYEQIEARTGLKPLVVSRDTSFQDGLDVRAPSSLFQVAEQCQVEATVDKVKEDRWLWTPVIRLSRDCSLLPHGASGAPAIRLDTTEIIGVFGTSSDANGPPCDFNNPCEIGRDGTARPGNKEQGYAHFVHKLYTCVDAGRNIDLSVPGCLLRKPQR